MKRNQLFLLSLCLSVQLSVAAAQNKPVTLRFWTNKVAQSPSFDKEIALFEKANPGIKVERTTTGGAQYLQTFDLAFKSGNAPDVFTLPFDNFSLKQVRDAGWIMPLNRWATREWQRTFPKGSFVEGVNVFDGKIVSAPWDAKAPNTIQLYVNTNVFRDAGLVDKAGKVLIPKTWDDVRRAARQITQKSDGKVYGWGLGAKQGDYALAIQSFPARLSGAVCGNFACLNYRTGRYEFASNPTWRAWFNHWFDLVEDKSIFPQSAVVNDEQARVLFAEGKFGMYLGGPWVPNSLKQTNAGFDDYVIAPLPTREGKARSFMYYEPGGVHTAISSQSKNPAAAWKLLAWLNSRASALRWASYGEGARIWPETSDALSGKAADVAKIAVTNVRLRPAFNSLRPDLADAKQKTITQNVSYYTLAALTGQLKRSELAATLKKLETDMNEELERAVAEARRGGSKVSAADFRFSNWNPYIDQVTLK